MKKYFIAPLMALSLSVMPALAETQKIWPHQKTMEVAFVLDTTGSMSGVIEGAKRKIWSIANSIQDLHPGAQVRFALIGYRDRGDAYVTKTFDLTTDVQKIYGELLAFRAAGGGDTPESVNQALHEAVDDLDWSYNKRTFRTIFLVGDAPPSLQYQDDVHYRDSAKQARQYDILINTIQAGSMQETVKYWQEIARLGGGDYVQIEQDGAMTFLETPYDDQLQRLNNQLNDTVVPYGHKQQQRAVQKKLMESSMASGAVASDMVGYITKSASKAKVITGGGDLIEQIETKELSINDIDEDKLSDEMKGMKSADRKKYLNKKIKEREELKEKITALVKQRDQFIADAEASVGEENSFDSEIESLIKRQTLDKSFTE